MSEMGSTRGADVAWLEGQIENERYRIERGTGSAEGHGDADEAGERL